MAMEHDDADDLMTEQEHASEKAWDLVEGALDPSSLLYREHGPDRLLAAAQVYATLATRDA